MRLTRSESCPHCQFSVNLSRHTLSNKSFRYCASCHSDLTEVADQFNAEKQLCVAQTRLANALYAKEPVAQDFATLKFLIKLIRQSLVSKKDIHRLPLQRFINLATDKRSPLCSISFTELAITDRYALLNAAFQLQSINEASFVDLLMESGVTRSAFLKDKNTLSQKMLSISKQLPHTQYKRSKHRKASEVWPEPRSQEATQRLLNILYKSIRAHGN